MRGINKKGFTLIELLAVIVVLAIVMVLAATTVLPYMANARKDAFALEVNTLKESATQAVSLITLGTANDDYYKEYTNGYCLTVQNLKDLALFEKDGNYTGGVIVKKTNQSYTYTVSMKNDEFYVKGVTSDAVSSDVKNVSDNGWSEFSCPTGNTLS